MMLANADPYRKGCVQLPQRVTLVVAMLNGSSLLAAMSCGKDSVVQLSCSDHLTFLVWQTASLQLGAQVTQKGKQTGSVVGHWQNVELGHIVEWMQTDGCFLQAAVEQADPSAQADLLRFREDSLLDAVMISLPVAREEWPSACY